MTSSAHFEITRRNVLNRIKRRPQKGEWRHTVEGGKDSYSRRKAIVRYRKVTKEYKCILHYEGKRAETGHESMIEAVNAMHTALLNERKIIFAEVVCITTERVAYQKPTVRTP